MFSPSLYMLFYSGLFSFYTTYDIFFLLLIKLMKYINSEVNENLLFIETLFVCFRGPSYSHVIVLKNGAR